LGTYPYFCLLAWFSCSVVCDIHIHRSPSLDLIWLDIPAADPSTKKGLISSLLFPSVNTAGPVRRPQLNLSDSEVLLGLTPALAKQHGLVPIDSNGRAVTMWVDPQVNKPVMVESLGRFKPLIPLEKEGDVVVYHAWICVIVLCLFVVLLV
jgi:hypothetical protein